MKNKAILAVFILAIIVVCYIIITWNTHENRLMRAGNELAQKIELYRAKNRHLPNSLADMGLEEDELGGYGPTIAEAIFYQKEDSLNYILWFGSAVGTSKTYSSATKKWKDN